MAESGGYAPPPLISAPSDTQQLGAAYLAPPATLTTPDDTVTVADDRQQELYNYELAERSYSEQDQMKTVAPWMTLGLGSAGLIGARFLNHFHNKTSPDEDFMHRLGRSAVQTLAPGLDSAVKHATTFGNWIDSIRSLHTLASTTKTPHGALRLVHSFVNDYAPPDKYAALMHATRIPRALLDVKKTASAPEEKGASLLKALGQTAIKDNLRSTMDPQAAALSLRYDHLPAKYHFYLQRESHTLQGDTPEVRTAAYSGLLDTAHKAEMSNARSKLMEKGLSVGQTYQDHENDAELGNKISKSALLASLGSTPARSSENISPLGEHEALQSGQEYLDNISQKLFERKEARSENTADIAARAGPRIGIKHEALPFPYISDDKKTTAAQARRLQEALGSNTSTDPTSPEVMMRTLAVRSTSLKSQFDTSSHNSYQEGPLETFLKQIPMEALSDPAKLKDLLDKAPSEAIKPYRPFIEAIGSSVVNKDDNALKELAVNYSINKTKSVLGQDHPVTEILNGVQKIQALRKQHISDPITGLLTTRYGDATSRPLDLSTESLRYHAAKSISSFAKGIKEGAGLQDVSFPARVWDGMRKIVEPASTAVTSVPEGTMPTRREAKPAETIRPPADTVFTHPVSLPPPESREVRAKRPLRSLPPISEQDEGVSTGDTRSIRASPIQARPAPLIPILDTSRHQGLHAVPIEDTRRPPETTSTESIGARFRDKLRTLSSSDLLAAQHSNEDQGDNWWGRITRRFQSTKPPKSEMSEASSAAATKPDKPATVTADTPKPPASTLEPAVRSVPRLPAERKGDSERVPDTTQAVPLPSDTSVSRTLSTTSEPVSIKPPSKSPATTSLPLSEPPRTDKSSNKETLSAGGDSHRALGDTSTGYTTPASEIPKDHIPSRFKTVPAEVPAKPLSTSNVDYIKSGTRLTSLHDLSLGPYQRDSKPFSHADFQPVAMDRASKQNVTQAIISSAERSRSQFDQSMKVPAGDAVIMKNRAASLALGNDTTSNRDPKESLSANDPRRQMDVNGTVVQHALASHKVLRSEYGQRLQEHWLADTTSASSEPLNDAALHQMKRGILGARATSNAMYVRDLLSKKMGIDPDHMAQHVTFTGNPLDGSPKKSKVSADDYRTYIIDHSHLTNVADARMLQEKVKKLTDNTHASESVTGMHKKYADNFIANRGETQQQVAKRNSIPITNAHVLDKIPSKQQNAYHEKFLDVKLTDDSDSDPRDAIWDDAREKAAKEAIKSHVDSIKSTPGIYPQAQRFENPFHSSTAIGMKLSDQAHTNLQTHLHQLATNPSDAPFVYHDTSPGASNLTPSFPTSSPADSSSQLMSSQSLSRGTTTTALTGSYRPPTDIDPASTNAPTSTTAALTSSTTVMPPAQGGGIDSTSGEGVGEESGAFN